MPCVAADPYFPTTNLVFAMAVLGRARRVDLCVDLYSSASFGRRCVTPVGHARSGGNWGAGPHMDRVGGNIFLWDHNDDTQCLCVGQSIADL